MKDHAAAAGTDAEVFDDGGLIRDYTGVYPPCVKTIAVITPASVPDPVTTGAGIELLRRAGYRVKVYPHVFDGAEEAAAARAAGKGQKSYISIAPELRIADFEAAWMDMENDMIICSRGGRGTVDLVAGVDWEKLPRRPELYVMGYSDVTLLLCAMSSRGYGRPVAGANISSHTGLLPEIIPEMKKMFNGEELTPLKLEVLVPGDCSGMPIAGLLNRLVTAHRSGYLPESRGKIIIIESVSSDPEQIGRDLEELRSSGFFSAASGIVFGHILRSGSDEDIAAVLEDFAGKSDIPVYRGLPFGHAPAHMTIDFARKAVIRDGILTFPAVK